MESGMVSNCFFFFLGSNNSACLSRWYEIQGVVIWLAELIVYSHTIQWACGCAYAISFNTHHSVFHCGNSIVLHLVAVNIFAVLFMLLFLVFSYNFRLFWILASIASNWCLYYCYRFVCCCRCICAWRNRCNVSSLRQAPPLSIIRRLCTKNNTFRRLVHQVQFSFRTLNVLLHWSSFSCLPFLSQHFSVCFVMFSVIQSARRERDRKNMRMMWIKRTESMNKHIHACALCVRTEMLCICVLSFSTVFWDENIACILFVFIVALLQQFVERRFAEEITSIWKYSH